VIFYPNTVTNYSAYAGGYDLYLCGPNTVVTDTVKWLNSYGVVYMNPNTTLIFSTGPTPLDAPYIFVKNTASLTVLAGSAHVQIFAEPNAVLSLPPGTTAVTCASISFPSANCVAGINENLNNDFFKVWPSPASTEAFIEFSSVQDKFLEITLTDQLGRIVKSFTAFPSEKTTIPLGDLPNGLYFVIVQTSSFTQIKKLIVLRQ
jgi:hypothetical protein